jgi:hypothetical protein
MSCFFVGTIYLEIFYRQPSAVSRMPSSLTNAPTISIAGSFKNTSAIGVKLDSWPRRLGDRRRHGLIP